MAEIPFDKAALTTVFEDGRAAFRRLRKGRLRVLTGVDRGQIWDIDKSRCSGGSSIINDFVLRDHQVAGTHFEILARDDGYRLRDLDSPSGIFLGPVRVRDIYLDSGIRFRVGDSELAFEWSDEVVDIELSKSDRYHEITGRSPAMRQVFAQLERIAPSELTCLIMGETGTGKERIARAIHYTSSRGDHPLVVLDCGSLPRQLIESTLFGHEKGSFTGALSQHRGCFEQAESGTIFLDEIGELDTSLQPKLLRVLEERQLMRIGGSRTIDVDVRVLAATHRDLRAEVNAGRFREDLYYRLSVVRLEVPALRHRVEDIPLLAEQFLHEAAHARGMRLVFDDSALQALIAHPWPGNVRELRNVVQRAAALCDGPMISRADLAFGDAQRMQPRARAEAVMDNARATDELAYGSAVAVDSSPSFKEAKQRVVQAFEAQYLRSLMERYQGNISRAARDAGLTRFHLRELLKRHQLVPNR